MEELLSSSRFSMKRPLSRRRATFQFFFFSQVYFYIRESGAPFSLYLRVSEPFSSSRTSKNSRNSPQMFRSRLARPNGGGGGAARRSSEAGQSDWQVGTREDGVFALK